MREWDADAKSALVALDSGAVVPLAAAQFSEAPSSLEFGQKVEVSLHTEEDGEVIAVAAKLFSGPAIRFRGHGTALAHTASAS